MCAVPGRFRLSSFWVLFAVFLFQVVHFCRCETLVKRLIDALQIRMNLEFHPWTRLASVERAFTCWTSASYCLGIVYVSSSAVAVSAAKVRASGKAQPKPSAAIDMYWCWKSLYFQPIRCLVSSVCENPIVKSICHHFMAGFEMRSIVSGIVKDPP